MPKPNRDISTSVSSVDFHELYERSKDPRLKEINRLIGEHYYELGLIMSGMALMSPLGAVPGMPLICAIFLTGISISFLIGSRKLLLPQKVEDVAIPRQRLKDATKLSERAYRVVSPLFCPRLRFLSGLKSKSVMAFLSLVIAILILFLGIIPFGVFIPGLMLALAGLGFLKQDGLVIAIVYAIPILAALGIGGVVI